MLWKILETRQVSAHLLHTFCERWGLPMSSLAAPYQKPIRASDHPAVFERRSLGVAIDVLQAVVTDFPG
jgi:hypothetical protein